MPTIKVSYSDLCQLIGKKIPKPKIEDLILLNKGEVDRWNDDDEMEVEIESDRVDLLATEGIARALKGVLGIEAGLPKYNVEKSNVIVNIDPVVNQIRPFIVSGIVENVELSDAGVAQVMQCQEKLHMTHSRNRRKASIGLHDLDKIKPPITYTARRPEDIYFVPLHEIKAMDGHQILQKVEKGRDYAHLIENSPVYPLLVDSEDTVLSLPPIINSDDTTVEPDTTNLFFDITCLDERVARIALNALVTNIAERKGQIKSVEIRYADGRVEVLPDLAPIPKTLHLDYVNRILGLNLKMKQLEDLIKKMRMDVIVKDKNTLEVLTPAYRADFIHEIDLVEDIAVAYGYNVFKPELPRVLTIGKEQPLETFTRKIRELMIGYGYQEIINYQLTNKDNLQARMNMPEKEVIEIANPVVSTYSILRDSLLPGMLDFLGQNLHAAYPQTCFETGDVSLIDEKAETKTMVKRHLCTAITAYSVSFENIQSILQGLMDLLQVKNFNLKPTTHPSFIPGRTASINLGKNQIGIIGEIIVPVLLNFGIENPVAIFELELNGLL
ncbi:MAG: phenylalanine--tRNA ligase subunit beta [Candidatus Helarchaeota archaeon]